MSEWKEVELGEIINLKRGYDLPNSNRVGGVVPIISSSGVTGCHNLHKEIGPGVVTGRYGTLGEFYYIKPGEKYWPLNTTLFVEDFKGNDPEFIYYLLSTLGFGKLGHKSAVPGLNRNELHEILVGIPDSDTQKEIARTLSIIDKKITLLHQQNRDLEDLAQTLFKRWFVEEQDPTWVFVVLSDVADVFIGRTPPRKEEEWFSRNKVDVKWVSIKDLGENGVYISQTSEFLTQKAMDKFKVPLIEPNTVLLSFKMTLGRVGITTEKMLSNEAIAQFRIKEASNLSSEFLYFFLKLFKYQNLGSTSSIVTSINSGMIKDIPMVLPDKKILTKFSNSVSPLFQKIKVNSFEIQTLTQLRDTLLPKLMSGELRVNIH
jgi:type I restriction enzyme S subunit